MVRFAVFLAAFFCALAHAATPSAPRVMGKAWMLGDVTSGQVLLAEKADERIEPASLTKLMTAYLVFNAIRDRKLALEQQVPVSARAWRAAGSRMFLDPRRPVTVDQLIKGMEVQSSNDACIALAEAVAGSEDAFVQLMNREAERLGLVGTHFMNPTGLPDAQHYSTARDLYTLAATLIREFPDEYLRYYAIKEFRYNNISQPNRNRLLWLDPTIDGVKTGQTEAAGYCLIASAKRGPRRLLSVLLGSTSETSRTQESLKLLNWGYQFFDDVKLFGSGEVVRTLEVWKGSQSVVKAGALRDLYVTVPKGEASKLKADVVSQQPIIAPIARGDSVATLRVVLDGKPLTEHSLVALEPIDPAGLLGRAWDTLRLWIK